MKLLLTGLAASLALLFAVDSGAARVHDFAGECETCHLSAPRQGKQLFVAEIDLLCRRCHPLAEQNTHPSPVTPGMAMPPGFWLDAQGRLTCATCHDPHPDDAGGTDNLLRSDRQGTGFCQLCHPEAVTSSGKHLSAVFLAHGKQQTPPGKDPSPEKLDAVSAACMTCHGGTGGPHTGFCTLGTKGNCTGHVLGVVYDEAVAQHTHLKPRESLPPTVSFYEGKVGCLSCHGLYSPNPKLLTATCTTCHKVTK